MLVEALADSCPEDTVNPCGLPCDCQQDWSPKQGECGSL